MPRDREERRDEPSGHTEAFIRRHGCNVRGNISAPTARPRANAFPRKRLERLPQRSADEIAKGMRRARHRAGAESFVPVGRDAVLHRPATTEGSMRWNLEKQFHLKKTDSVAKN